MREGWEIKTWDEVLEVRSGRNQKNVLNPDGKYPVMGSAGKVMGYADSYLCDEGTTIVGRKGTIDKPLYIETKFWNVDTAFGLVAGEKLVKKYLFNFCLSYDFKSLDKGTTLPSLVKKDLIKIEIPIPPLQEQKQIVTILDKAFTAIDQAKANIEKNIENAKELFQSKREEFFIKAYEISGNKSEILQNLCTIKTGKLNANAMVDNGKYPFFTCSREIFSIDNYAFDTEAVLLAGNNASGDFNVKYYKGKFNAYQRTYVITIDKEVGLSYSFLKHKLEHNLQAFKRQSVGANTRFLKIGMINNLEIPIPTIKIQKKLCRNLDLLNDDLEFLISCYSKKLNSLEELKKSILQKAFAGELTSPEGTQYAKDGSIPSTKSIITTKNPERVL